MTDHDSPSGPAAPPRRTPSPPPPDLHDDGHDGLDEHWDDEFHDEHDDHDDHGGELHDDHWDDEFHDEDDWHDDHPGPGRRPWLVAAGIAVALAVVATLLVWVWYGRQVDPPGGPGAPVAVEVPSGASVRGIGALLEDKGVISNATVFNFYAGRRNAGPFQAGVYQLQENSSFDQVLQILQAGPSEPLLAEVADTVSIPEGFTVARILDRLAGSVPGTDRAALQGSLDRGEIETSLRPADQPSYEGLLFPATYELPDGVTAVSVLQDMATEMEVRLERLDVTSARTRLAQEWGLELTDHQFLTVASMIQAEAGNAEEAPKIATVIYNRLAQGMPLGIDAVDRYGAELAGTEVDFTNGDLPYNTRRRQGLPPTPIAAPGEFALKAALSPAEGDWLFYVLQEERSHVFVTTNAEFLEAKRICREKGLGCG